MSAKKKRPRKAEKTGPKKVEGPFFRPFSDLSPDVLSKPEAQAKTGPPSPKPRPAPKSPSRSDEQDLLTFERFMAGVEPLQASKARRVSSSQTDVQSNLTASASEFARQQNAADQEAREKLRTLVEEGSRFEVLDDGRRIEGRRRGVDGGLVRRMRHGEIPVDATLDLHGMRVEAARLAVESFVRDRRAKGDRVVVLVHGHGRNSLANQPVLRGEVAAWLSEGEASKHVSAFSTAPPEHGGEGAVSVLLAQASDSHRGMR